MGVFRVYGGIIEYERRPFARIIMSEYSGLILDAREDLESIDPAGVEEQINAAVDDAEKVLQTEIDELEMKVSDLEKENKALESLLDAIDDGLLDAIDDGMTALEIIENCKKEVAKWRAIAETNRKAYIEAMKPKPRKRKVAV